MDGLPQAELVEIKNLDKLGADDEVHLGQWFLMDKTDNDLFYETGRYEDDHEVRGEGGRSLVCSDRFESNLVIFKSNCKEYRVLNKDLGHVVTPIKEHEALALLRGRVEEKQVAIIEAREKINDIMAIINMSGTTASSSTAVAVSSKNAIMEQSTALKNVHSKNLEKYNNEIKGYVGDIHKITQYHALPAMIGIDGLSRTKDVIDEKLHELSLYGGLDEDEVDISTGGVVNESLPIHIFQNLKYMDVEAIVGYEFGGIGLADVKEFNKWLAIPENRDRVLPNQKSIVAIKTRKYRDFKMGFYGSENHTYLYMRNGENIRSIRTHLSISKTLLATEHDTVKDVYAKKLGVNEDMSKNFLYLSKNEYEELTDRAKKHTPLWMNLLLESYREALKFMEATTPYAKLRHEKLRAVTDRENKLTLRASNYARPTYSYRLKTDAEFNDDMNAQLELIEQTKDKIEQIKKSISNGFYDVNLHFPYVYNSRKFRLEDGEIGFTDPDGNEYHMAYNIVDYADKLKEIEDRFDVAQLYFPNNSRDGRSAVTPFNILKVLKDYRLINEDNFFFDALKAANWKKYKRQNDLAVLIQGILDRTNFFGHTKVSLFQDGFEDKIKLVYDKDKGLYDGDMPDFNAFMAECNRQSKKGDVFVGQQKLWDALESEKERDDRYYYSIHMPKFLEAEKIVKKRDGRTVVCFRWETDRKWYSKAKSPVRVHRFECDIDRLLNVSNYKLDDCKPFTSDPRCRDLYRRWGGLIMAAERYHQENSENS